MPASQAARLAPSAPPRRSVSSSRTLKFAPSLMPRPPETTTLASPRSGRALCGGVQADQLGAERVDRGDGDRLDRAGARRRVACGNAVCRTLATSTGPAIVTSSMALPA